ncbi:hypothetical protein [Spirosoma jeollabukense]
MKHIFFQAVAFFSCFSTVLAQNAGSRSPAIRFIKLANMLREGDTSRESIGLVERASYNNFKESATSLPY